MRKYISDETVHEKVHEKVKERKREKKIEMNDKHTYICTKKKNHFDKLMGWNTK